MRLLLPALLVSGATALACSYSMVVWGPASDAEPPYYQVWGGRNPGWIDRTGKRVSYEPPEAASEPNWIRPVADDGRYGLYRAGEFVKPVRLIEARKFSEGLARVIAEGPCIPIDAGVCGAPAILPPSAVPASVSRLDVLSGRWRPTAPACRYTFVDERGEFAGQATFEDAGDFHEGLAAVRVDGRWGYVDRNLTTVIPPQFEGADAFSEGLAAVRGETGVSYIDRNGRVVIAGPFDQADDFHEGVAAVYRDRRAHYIDRRGQAIYRWNLKP